MPAQLEALRRRHLAAPRAPREHEEHVRAAQQAALVHHTAQHQVGDVEPRLLAQLAPQPGERVLPLLEEAAERVPETRVGLDCAAAEQDAELGEYVRELEERVGDAGIQPLTGDEIANEFEKYLRRRGGSAGPTAGSW